MRNYSTIVDITKVQSGTDTLLAGARLQLRKDTGEVIRNGRPRKMVARNSMDWSREPMSFMSCRHQLDMSLAGDQEIVVTENNDTTQVFQYENRPKSSSGGGGGGVETSQNPKVDYISFKKIDSGGMPVAGAEFTFYRGDGSVLDTAVSDAKRKDYD